MWNNHRIRRSRGTSIASGRPNLLYDHPELFRAVDCLEAADTDDYSTCLDECIPRSSCPCDQDIFNLCCHLMQEEHISMPHSIEEALTVYISIRDLIRYYMGL